MKLLKFERIVIDKLNKTYICIANIQIEIISSLTTNELSIASRLGQFIGFSENPLSHVVLHLETSIVPPIPKGHLIYDPGLIWKMYKDGNDFFADITYHRDDQVSQEHGVLHANPTWDFLTLTECRSSLFQQSLLNIGAGELILRTVILFTGGLVFHSSGLDDNGKGIVFVGHSGDGKSTQLNLWNHEPGVIAMNDDRIAIQIESSSPKCYGLPWGGSSDIARNHSAPLSAIIILEQAPINEIRQTLPSESYSLLMARAFLPYWDQSLMVIAMSNLTNIIATVPVYRLRYRPEQAVIPLVRSIL